MKKKTYCPSITSKKNMITAGLLPLFAAGCTVAPIVPPNAYETEYPAPTYVSASSCRSESVAMKRLIEQLQVTVDTESLSIQKIREGETGGFKDDKTSKNVLRLESGERLRGLVIRRFGPGNRCVFVAIDKKHAKNSYARDVKEESQTIGRLFSIVKNPSATVLQKLRAGLELEKRLSDLKNDNNALEMLSDRRVHRLHVSGDDLEKLYRSIGFSVNETYVRSGAVLPLGNDYEGILESAITQAGYRFMDPMAEPDFVLTLQVKVAEGPLDARVGKFPYDIDLSVLISENETGKVLVRKFVNRFVQVDSPMELTSEVLPSLKEEIKGTLISRALESLKEKTSDVDETKSVEKESFGGEDF